MTADNTDKSNNTAEGQEVNSTIESSTFLTLVNDPGIVVIRRSIGSESPLRWIAHNISDLLGYRSEALLGFDFGVAVDSWSSLVHRESKKDYRDFILKLRTSDKAGCLYRLLAADGSYRFVREESRVVRNYEEQVVDIVGCLIDWTGITPIQASGEVVDHPEMDEESTARQYRMREVELVADLIAAHSYIRNQARGYRDAVQTLTQITDRLRQNPGAANGALTGVQPATEDAYEGERLPVGVYRSQPAASRTLSQANSEAVRLIALDQHGIDADDPVGFDLSRITTPDIAQTNEETVDLAIQSREDFDLIYPVVERIIDSDVDQTADGREASASGPRWLRWIWEQGRVQYDANDKPVAIHGVITDVTDSMAAELDGTATIDQSEISFGGPRLPGDLQQQLPDSQQITSTIFELDESAGVENSRSFHGSDATANVFDEYTGSDRLPLMADDEVVAVFNSSNMLSVDSPTVELDVGSDEVSAGSKATESDLALSVSGAEIASWDSDDAVPDLEVADTEGLFDFQYSVEDAPWKIDVDSESDAGGSLASQLTSNSRVEYIAVLDESCFDNFKLFVQPAFLIDATSRPLYVEVLLRMKHVDGELLRPGQFSLHQSQAELQVRIDHWVVRRAIEDLVNGLKGAEEVGIAINLSRHSVGDGEFLNFVQSCIEDAALKPSRISFEIPSDRGGNELVAIRGFMNKVRQYGCRVTLDNFGGEGVTLQNLRELPVDRVKIDGSLVKNVVENEVDRSIIAAICQVAEDAGIDVTAQHVEQEAVIDTLADLGIKIIQGDGLASAQPITSLSRH